MKEDQKIAIYQTEDGQTQIDVRLENETVWLNVAQMASLFMKEESNVRRHVLNAFKEGELERSDNNVHFLHVNGVKKPVPFYSLDVIISVGYRVKSKRGTAFRIWARKIIKDYLVKGYAVNERIRKEQIGELRQLVQVASRAISSQRGGELGPVLQLLVSKGRCAKRSARRAIHQSGGDGALVTSRPDIAAQVVLLALLQSPCFRPMPQ